MSDKEQIISEFERCIELFSVADTSDDYFKCVCQRVLELLNGQDMSRLAKATAEAEEFLSKAPYLCYDLAKELIVAAKEVIYADKG